MSERSCHYCGASDLLRPYGPGGSWVCWPCGSSPEHEAETRVNMALAFAMAEAASAAGSVVIGPDVEPSPLVSPPRDEEAQR